MVYKAIMLNVNMVLAYYDLMLDSEAELTVDMLLAYIYNVPAVGGNKHYIGPQYDPLLRPGDVMEVGLNWHGAAYVPTADRLAVESSDGTECTEEDRTSSSKNIGIRYFARVYEPWRIKE